MTVWTSWSTDQEICYNFIIAFGEENTTELDNTFVFLRWSHFPTWELIN